jgi:hypothetical protein
MFTLRVLPRWNLVFAPLAGLLLGLSTFSVSNAAPPVPIVGLNKFDLFKQYLGTASGGDGSAAYRRVTRAMAKKAIADAHDIGVPFFRISATGYAPSSRGAAGDLDLWQRDPSAYWALFDQMMDDLHAHGIRAVLTLVWNPAQFPVMAKETVPTMLRDPKSKSYSLLSQYVTELVSRYRSHPATMFYELTNELNLGADLDLVNRCRKERKIPQLCDAIGNYSTDDLIAFTNRLSGLIHTLDHVHPISSGFSVPRPNADGLRKKPEWQTGKLASADTLEQLRQYMSAVSQAADIISVHLYENKSNRRFGLDNSVDLLPILKQIADQIGKPLFVGEFGDPDAPSAKEGSFSDRMLKKIAEMQIPYSAVWVWEFYQKNTRTTRDNKNNTFSLEPGYTDYLIGRIRQANLGQGHVVAQINEPDTQPPRVVLTWPLECTTLNKPTDLYAVASDDSGPVEKVEFLLDGVVMAVDPSPPYQASLSPMKGKAGLHRLTARAYDSAGNTSEYSSMVVVGKGAEKTNCTVSP